MRLRAQADGRASKLKAEVEELRTALVQQQAAFPPEALNSARDRANALEARADRAEQLVGTLRQQCDTWKAKAREATRSERLARMAAAEDATPQRAVPVDAETKAAIARLQAEVDHWRSEAAGEVARQRTFQKELWTNEAFTAPQKQHIISMLRAAGLKDAEVSPEALMSIAAGSTELPSPS